MTGTRKLLRKPTTTAFVLVATFGCVDGTGWNLEGMRAAKSGCTVQRFGVKDLPQAVFDAHFRENEPVIITGLTGNMDFRTACHREELLQKWGDKEVVLSTANTYSYDKVTMSLRDYIANHMGYPPANASGKDTLYHFGDNNHTEWAELFRLYSVPPLVPPDADVALSFGLGGPGSGVPFHIHGPGWSETVIGRKLWLLYPPEKKPPFDPDERSVLWSERWEKGLIDFEPMYCVLSFGEAIYFPNGWWHSTVNLDQSVFVSSFVLYAPPTSSSVGRGGGGASGAERGRGGNGGDGEGTGGSSAAAGAVAGDGRNDVQRRQDRQPAVDDGSSGVGGWGALAEGPEEDVEEELRRR